LFDRVNHLKMKIQLKVKPNSRQQKIEESPDGSSIVWLKSSPTDGKANRELIEILAKKYRVAKSNIKITSGLSVISNHKLSSIVSSG
jgi:uncharacterized protein